MSGTSCALEELLTEDVRCRRSNDARQACSSYIANRGLPSGDNLSTLRSRPTVIHGTSQHLPPVSESGREFNNSRSNMEMPCTGIYISMDIFNSSRQLEHPPSTSVHTAKALTKALPATAMLPRCFVPRRGRHTPTSPDSLAIDSRNAVPRCPGSHIHVEGIKRVDVPMDPRVVHVGTMLGCIAEDIPDADLGWDFGPLTGWLLAQLAGCSLLPFPRTLPALS